MKLILRTTALLAFANAISLQTETATYESRMSDSFVDQATLLAETTMDTEAWLAQGLDTVKNYSWEGMGNGRDAMDSPLEVKADDLKAMGRAYYHFSEILKDGTIDGNTVDAAGVNRLIKVFESSLVGISKDDEL